jgi:REP-associated tyrosine transposase
VPRPLRDQSAGIVHLIWRGNRRQRIFDDDLDRERYLALLAEACRRCGWWIDAYCLLTNHVHLMAHVTDGTLSRGMQWLGGRYAAAYNVRHGFAGHLFQCRFRSERVEDDVYALELARYVDLNPKRAGAAQTPRRWRWSSYRALAGLEQPRPFHDVDWILGQLALDRRRAHGAYEAFVAAARDELRRPDRDRSLADMSRGQTPGHVRTEQGFRVVGGGQPAP